jgi:hypothetical protein
MFHPYEGGYTHGEDPYESGPEFDSDRCFYVGDKEVGDLDNEGDWGIDFFSGPFTREEAEREVEEVAGKMPHGRVLAIREDTKRAMEDQAEAARDRARECAQD